MAMEELVRLTITRLVAIWHTIDTKPKNHQDSSASQQEISYLKSDPEAGVLESLIQIMM